MSRSINKMAPKQMELGKRSSSGLCGYLFERHQLKSLNLALILYLCFGAFLFDYLSEFGNVTQRLNHNQVPLSSSSKSLKSQVTLGRVNDKRLPISLGRLRSRSVARMWNITNKLNILYESNWTALVLEELINFEQQLIDSIKSNPLDEILSEASDFGELDLDLFDSNNGQDNSDKIKSKNSKQQFQNNKQDFMREKLASLQRAKRIKSIKKSIIHSLATITTIGWPNGKPKSKAAKLATILYGCLGIPLLVVTVSQSGKKLAQTSLNWLLILRHYFFKLPAYYLCCSCSFYECFRWLSWCCCCCCCCCRFLFCLSDKYFKGCGKGRPAPKLKLPQRNSTRTLNQRSLNSEITRSSLSGGGGADYPTTQANPAKSVRFGDSCKVGDGIEAEQQPPGDGVRDFKNLQPEVQSWGVFKTSCFVLALYFLLGAYILNYSENASSLIDSIYDCYAMLSMSELPKAFKLLDSSNWNPMLFYQRLSSNLTTNPVELILETTPNLDSGTRGDTLWFADELTLNCIYMIIGLNLVSACAYFAKLCYLTNRAEIDEIKKRLSISGDEEDRDDDKKIASHEHCNGHLATVMGSFENKKPIFTESHQQPPPPPPGASYVNVDKSAYGLFRSAGGCSSATASTEPASSIIADQQQQKSPSLNMTELFVINHQHESQPSNQNFQTNDQEQQQQQIISDVSFASDRSGNSLCHHHQQQQQQQLSVAASPIKTSLYHSTSYQDRTLGGTMQRQSHHHPPHLHQLTGSQVYLPTHNQIHNALLPVSNILHQHADDDDDDPNEMDRMLKSCVRHNSSLMHIPQQQQQQQQPQFNGINGNCHQINGMSSTSDANESSSSQQGPATDHHHGSYPKTRAMEAFHQASSTFSRNRPVLPIGIALDAGQNGTIELDTSFNTIDTNSNTISSASSRTVKQPERHMPQNGFRH